MNVNDKRTKSGHFEVGDGDDGAIMEMKDMQGKMLVIKERAIYEVSFADTIDPKREYPDLPANVQKKLIDLGTESQLASKTYLMALKMMKPEYISAYVDVKRALEVSFELLLELHKLNQEKESYRLAEKAAIEEYELRRGQKLDYKLPSIPDIQTRCKTFFQKADHVLQTLMEINSLFFIEKKLHKQAHFDTFLSLLKEEYGEKDDFVKMIEQVLPFLKKLRALRDCLDHRQDGVIITDFDLQLNNNVLTPTISLNFRKETIERMPLEMLMDATTKNLLYTVESTLALLCGKHVCIDKMMPYCLRFIPKQQRRNKYIKYAFWSPIGELGWFYQ
ncbi:hypothetical protein SAMN05216524_10421 [Mucilaginibacter sp. OK098]|nr:hypothetical protein SAMN05216524_10421 [Mucilaginibacter sp. OK098]